MTVQPKDVLINITGASFLRTCVVDPGVLPARVNQHVAIVRAAKGVPPHFLHLNLVRPWMKEFLAGHDAGGSRQAITKAHLEGAPILRSAASGLREVAVLAGQEVVGSVVLLESEDTTAGGLVRCVGDLAREGRGRVLQNPRDFALSAEEEA